MRISYHKYKFYIDDLKNKDTSAIVQQRLALYKRDYLLWSSIFSKSVDKRKDVGAGENTA